MVSCLQLISLIVSFRVSVVSMQVSDHFFLSSFFFLFISCFFFVSSGIRRNGMNEATSSWLLLSIVLLASRKRETIDPRTFKSIEFNPS